ncbi:SEC-C metal-binding domain-containing protein [Shewanella xiamenensis]|uniref:SEC-C metal-binding domain-containing protein n=1 Tax=Shewanella xiamenensis TaxID=332186 RepID=UPI00244C093F|nr:SEC-C metal-binding domain-containing protein [Shewanella xiamenensis]MDH1314998.1 SEC-C metal-binding domain-containing protein [Shewanella xiamenensis]
MNSISDSELVRLFDKEISETYNRAKRLYKSAPIQTLILLRAIATNIAYSLLEDFQDANDEVDLYGLLISLEKKRAVNPEIVHYLHQIRKSGNRAAHPEQFYDNEHDLVNQARKVLLALCDTVDLIRTSVHGVAPVKYYFEEPTEMALQDASYRAIFNNDPQAKFEVAISLIEGNKLRIDHELTKCGLSETDKDGHLKNAIYFLESSSNFDHLDSRFALGLIYQQGLGCKSDIDKAIDHMYYCASHGNVMAKAYFGFFVMNMSDADIYDKQCALEFLEEAAKMRNPLAQNLLSEMYSVGNLVDKNQARAIELLTEAANSGYPESQYRLAELYHQSGEVEKYWELIEKAINNNHAPANLSAARVSAFNDSHHRALEYYTRYLEIKDDAIAQFEYGQLKLKTAAENSAKIKAGIWDLVLSYRNQNCPSEVRKQIETIVPKHLEILDRLVDISSLNEKGQKDLFVFYMQFKSNGLPHESMEAVCELMLKLGSRNIDAQSLYRVDSVKSNFYLPKNYKARASQARSSLAKIKIGRNEPCNCGSGRKYKQCCGK